LRGLGEKEMSKEVDEAMECTKNSVCAHHENHAFIIYHEILRLRALCAELAKRDAEIEKLHAEQKRLVETAKALIGLTDKQKQNLRDFAAKIMIRAGALDEYAASMSREKP
jgi:cell division protein FtsB